MTVSYSLGQFKIVSPVRISPGQIYLGICLINMSRTNSHGGQFQILHRTTDGLTLIQKLNQFNNNVTVTNKERNKPGERDRERKTGRKETGQFLLGNRNSRCFIEQNNTAC